MDMRELNATARELVAEGKGILAADESERDDQEAVRLDRRRVDRGEPARLPAAALHGRGRGGLHQRRHPLRRDDPPVGRRRHAVPEAARSRKGVIPGIKVDAGAKPLALAEGETVTEGLDGLRERLDEYRELGARFAKWRATYSIGGGSRRASTASGRTRTRSPATRRSARRPGSCRSSSRRCSRTASTRSSRARRRPAVCSRPSSPSSTTSASSSRGTLLKPNMVLSGYEALGPRRRRRGGGEDARVLLPARARGCPGDRLPLRRPDGRGRDGAPERDEPARPASVAALVLVRARAPGACAQGLGRRGRTTSRPASGLPPPREAERRGADGELLGRDGGDGRGVGLGPASARSPAPAGRTRPAPTGRARRRRRPDADAAAEAAGAVRPLREEHAGDEERTAAREPGRDRLADRERGDQDGERRHRVDVDGAASGPIASSTARPGEVRAEGRGEAEEEDQAEIARRRAGDGLDRARSCERERGRPSRRGSRPPSARSRRSAGRAASGARCRARTRRSRRERSRGPSRPRADRSRRSRSAITTTTPANASATPASRRDVSRSYPRAAARTT